MSVLAHGLLNDLAAIQGLIVTARSALDPATPEQDRADYLLQLGEVKAITMAESLRRHVQGVGLVEVEQSLVDSSEVGGIHLEDQH